MRHVAATVIAIAAVLGAGCASGARVAQPLEGDIVIEVERGANVPPGRVFLRPVPGGMLGEAAGASVLRSAPGSDRVELDVETLAARVAGRAATVRSDRFNPGELAEPRDLRIARLGMFFTPGGDAVGCGNFRTSLLAYPGRRMLVYVDRPGSIRGSRYASPWIFEYELVFPAAGIYLVGSTTQGIVVTQQVVASPRDVVARVRRAPCA